MGQSSSSLCCTSDRSELKDSAKDYERIDDEAKPIFQVRKLNYTSFLSPVSKLMSLESGRIITCFTNGNCGYMDYDENAGNFSFKGNMEAVSYSDFIFNIELNTIGASENGDIVVISDDKKKTIKIEQGIFLMSVSFRREGSGFRVVIVDKVSRSTLTVYETSDDFFFKEVSRKQFTTPISHIDSDGSCVYAVFSSSSFTSSPRLLVMNIMSLDATIASLVLLPLSLVTCLTKVSLRASIQTSSIIFAGKDLNGRGVMCRVILGQGQVRISGTYSDLDGVPTKVLFGPFDNGPVLIFTGETGSLSIWKVLGEGLIKSNECYVFSPSSVFCIGSQSQNLKRRIWIFMESSQIQSLE